MKCGWVMGLVLACLGMGFANDAVVLKFVTEDLPPYNMEYNGRATGWVTEKVQAIANRSGVVADIEVLSWARAFELARTQPDYCVFSTAQTPERLSQFRWIGPLVNNEWVLWRLKSGAPLSRLEDARNARIGGYHASAGTKKLQAAGYSVVVSANHEVSLRNLLIGRLDYWLAGRYTALVLIAEAGALDRVVPALQVDHFQMFLACNPHTHDATFKKLEAAYSQLSREGGFAAIDKRYESWTPTTLRHRPDR